MCDDGLYRAPLHMMSKRFVPYLIDSPCVCSWPCTLSLARLSSCNTPFDRPAPLQDRCPKVHCLSYVSRPWRLPDLGRLKGTKPFVLTVSVEFPNSRQLSPAAAVILLCSSTTPGMLTYLCRKIVSSHAKQIELLQCSAELFGLRRFRMTQVPYRWCLGQSSC
jgi:hypothetical protein